MVSIGGFQNDSEKGPAPPPPLLPGPASPRRLPSPPRNTGGGSDAWSLHRPWAVSPCLPVAGPMPGTDAGPLPGPLETGGTCETGPGPGPGRDCERSVCKEYAARRARIRSRTSEGAAPAGGALTSEATSRAKSAHGSRRAGSDAEGSGGGRWSLEASRASIELRRAAKLATDSEVASAAPAPGALPKGRLGCPGGENMASAR